MEYNQSPNMIDTTDSLEAVNVFKSMKNFTFWLIILSMLVLMGLFLMARFDLIGHPQESQLDNEPVAWQQPAASRSLLLLAAQPQAPEVQNDEPTAETTPADSQPAEEAVETDPLTDPAGTNGEAAEAPQETLDPIEQQAREVTGEGEPEMADEVIIEDEPLRAEPENDGPGEPFIDWSKIRLTPPQASMMIRIFNYICLISAILYSLILLFALKISLTGRLGGIRHIARAFFISLFALVFLFPWQAILPRVLIGALYLPGELIGDKGWLAEGSDASNVLILLRFVGLWLLVFVLYFWAQFRSMKWARAILRRLGVVR